MTARLALPLLTLLTFLAAAPAQAYRFTPVTAVASATQTQQTVGGTAVASDALAGLGGGFSWELPLNESYGVEFGGFYLQRKYGTTTISNAFRSLEIPLQLRLNLGNFSLGAGGFYARNLGSLRVTDVNGATTTFSYDEAQLKTTEVGILGSAGLVIPWSTTAGLIFEGRYLRGLNNCSSATGATLKFADFQFLLGLTFGTHFSFSPVLD